MSQCIVFFISIKDETVSIIYANIPEKKSPKCFGVRVVITSSFATNETEEILQEIMV